MAKTKISKVAKDLNVAIPTVIDFLRKKGIRAYIERKTNDQGNVGCGYVIVATGKLKNIVADLQGIGIKILDTNTVA